MVSGLQHLFLTHFGTLFWPLGRRYTEGKRAFRRAHKLRDNFFPDPDLIVTEYAHELSGMFIALRDIFYEHRLVDARNMYEFFGRLARAAKSAIGNRTSRRYSKSYMLLSVFGKKKIFI